MRVTAQPDLYYLPHTVIVHKRHKDAEQTREGSKWASFALNLEMGCNKCDTHTYLWVHVCMYVWACAKMAGVLSKAYRSLHTYVAIAVYRRTSSLYI